MCDLFLKMRTRKVWDTAAWPYSSPGVTCIAYIHYGRFHLQCSLHTYGGGEGDTV